MHYHGPLRAWKRLGPGSEAEEGGHAKEGWSSLSLRPKTLTIAKLGALVVHCPVPESTNTLPKLLLS